MTSNSYKNLIGIFALLAAGILLSGCTNQQPAPVPTACGTDLYACSDGSHVARNPDNNCNFNACPSPATCAAGTTPCYDGSYVSRNLSKNCAYDSCPAPVACPADAKLCPDGTAVGRNSSNNCAFEACPIPTACTNELKLCYDGSYVSRNLSKQCIFDTCQDTIIPDLNQTNSSLAAEGETCAGVAGIKCQSGLQCIISGQPGAEGACNPPAPPTNEMQQCPSTRNTVCTDEVNPVCGKLGTEQAGFRDYTNPCKACATDSNAIGYYMGTCENQG